MDQVNMKPERVNYLRCSGPALFLSLLCCAVGTLFLLLSATPVGIVFWAAGLGSFLPCLYLRQRSRAHIPIMDDARPYIATGDRGDRFR